MLLFRAIFTAALLLCFGESWGAWDPRLPISSERLLGDIPARPVPPRRPFEQFFKIRPLDHVGFSPDNQTIFFIRNDGEIDNVFAMDLATESLRQVTHYHEPVQNLLIGNQGHSLFIVQDEGGNERYDISRFDLSTGLSQRLTHSPPNEMSYICAQSPDGRFLYYGQSQGVRTQSSLWRIDLKTRKNELVLASRGRLLECGDISPDGRYLVFYQFVENNERHLGLVDLEKNLHFYIFYAPQVNNINASFLDDRRLLFMNAMGADYFYLWQYQIDTGRLLAGRGPLAYPLESFSIQAQGQIAIFYYRVGLRTRTFVYVDRSRNQMHYPSLKEPLYDALFSPTDPGVALFITADTTQPERYYLFHAAVQGSAKSTAATQGVEFKDRSLGAASRSIAVSAHKQAHSVADTDGWLKMIYDANQTGIPQDEFAEARSLLIPSYDGLLIPLHLFIPNGTSKKQPRPVIIWVHGGPDEHIDPDFDSYFQYLNNQGFIVAAPNVRGSTGFGKWYAMLDDGDWGGGHVQDILAVAEFLRGLEFVQPQRIALFGESFGGFIVLSAITQYPNHFNAAVVFFGISELATFIEGLPRSADPYLLGQLGFDPRKDAQRNIAVSPYYHVQRITIPVQIHQGKNDLRVKQAQTDQLVAKMRALGLPIDYYTYDEGHGFLNFSNESLAYRRVVEFLSRY